MQTAQTIDAAQIDVSLLPKTLQEMVRVIGLTAALDVCKAYPAIVLYVPKIPHPEHILAHLIGMPAFTRMCEYYDGDYLKPPKLDRALTQLKHHQLEVLVSEGHSSREIAIALDYSQRYVEQLRSKNTHKHPDLFES